MKKIILIPDHQLEEFNIEQNVLSDYFDIITNPNLLNSSSEKNVVGILSWHMSILNNNYLSKFTNLDVIVRIGAGYDNVDLDYCSKNNIKVSNIPDYGVEDVADHALTLFLTLERGLKDPLTLKKSNDWSWKSFLNHRRLSDLNFGIIGLGKIGIALSMRLKSICKDIGFFDPYVSHGIEKSLKVKRFSNLYDLLNWSDAISLHCNLTDETKAIINNDFINNLKPNVTLINTARGGLFNQNDLLNGLLNNKIYKLGTDVLFNEKDPFNDPLFHLANELQGRIIISPHCAFTNKSSLFEMRNKAANEIKNILLYNVQKYQIYR